MIFNKTEWEILQNRLTLPDCIAEGLTEEFDGVDPDTGSTAKEIYERAERICDTQNNIDWNNPVDRLILEDCCLGCTFFANLQEAVAHGEITKSQATAYKRAATTLSKKLGVEVASW